MFKSWAALKQHLVGPAHARLTVICPWCERKERTFTRVADLKQHAIKAHADKGAEDSLFSRGIGFYFARYPMDYVRIVEEVAKYEDAGASKARSLMRNWAETMPNSHTLTDKLNRGWKTERSADSSAGESRQQQRKESREAREAVENPPRNEVAGKDDGDERNKGGKKRGNSLERSSRGEKRKRILDNESDNELNNYADNVEVREPDSSSSESDTDSEDEESQDQPQQSASTKDLATKEKLRVRATRLLMKGVMPMCPPAQRDWSKVAELTLEREHGKLVWPPKNWRTLTADQRLMAHEYAALFLEQGTGNQFPAETSRRLLLDKYNFLSLEGAARPRVEGPKHKSEDKLRYYNYLFLSGVATGRTDDRVARSIVGSLETADRWKDTDHLTEYFDENDIKLRI
jgi:hypothetical protein